MKVTSHRGLYTMYVEFSTIAKKVMIFWKLVKKFSFSSKFPNFSTTSKFSFWHLQYRLKIHLLYFNNFLLLQLYGQQEQNLILPWYGVTKLWKIISPPRGVGGPKFFGHELGIGIPWKWTTSWPNRGKPLGHYCLDFWCNAC